MDDCDIGLWIYNNTLVFHWIGHPMCAQYWPKELNGEVTHGDITIKFISQDDDDVVDYTVREFLISNSNVSSLD